MRSVVELFVRLGRHRAAAVLLGAIECNDSENLFGEDAERLAGLRHELRRRFGPDLDGHLVEGYRLDRLDLLAFVRAELVATGTPPTAEVASV